LGNLVECNLAGIIPIAFGIIHQPIQLEGKMRRMKKSNQAVHFYTQRQS
jgi:hypothetical protein